MMRHIWSVLCSKQSIDRETNSISLFEVIEGVQFYTKAIPSFPSPVPFAGTLVTLWARSTPGERAKGVARVRLLSPEGTELLSQTMEVNLESHPRNRSILQLQGIVIGGPGVHAWEVSSRAADGRWETQATIPMDVAVSTTPPAAKAVN